MRIVSEPTTDQHYGRLELEANNAKEGMLLDKIYDKIMSKVLEGVEKR